MRTQLSQLLQSYRSAGLERIGVPSGHCFSASTVVLLLGGRPFLGVKGVRSLVLKSGEAEESAEVGSTGECLRADIHCILTGTPKVT